ncbi:MAG: hypothetical protein QW514_09205 [Thermoprotei archaeon]
MDVQKYALCSFKNNGWENTLHGKPNKAYNYNDDRGMSAMFHIDVYPKRGKLGGCYDGQ